MKISRLAAIVAIGLGGTAHGQVQGPELLSQNSSDWTPTDSPSNWRLGYFAVRWDNGVVTNGSRRHPVSLIPGKRYRAMAFGASGRSGSSTNPSNATIGIAVEGGLDRIPFAMNNLNTLYTATFIAGQPPHTAVISYHFVTLGAFMGGVARVEYFRLSQLFNVPQLDLPTGPLTVLTDCPAGDAATVDVPVSSLSEPDDPTQWQVSWGDGTSTPNPALNAIATHVFRLAPGEAERAFTVTLTGSNPAGEASDSLAVVVRRRSTVPPPVAPGSISACPSIPSTLSVQGEFRPTTTFRWQWRSRVGGPWIDVAEGLNTPPDPIEGPEFVATGVASRTVGLTLREAGSDPASSWTFRCLLDGPCGVIETAPAVLAANPASTRIVGQPIAAIVAAGQGAAFTCAATGTALTYQWRRNGTALIDGPNYGGVNSPTLLVRQVGASDQGTYDCLVSGSCGVVASSSVSLTCRPRFGVHPAGGVFVAQDSVTLTAELLNPGNSTYRWLRNGARLVNSRKYAGVATTSLTIATDDPNDSGRFSLEATSPCGTTVSEAADVVVVCPADFNADGGVDGGDIDTFFASWEAGQSSADINRDGGIDGSDVSSFFERWESGC